MNEIDYEYEDYITSIRCYFIGKISEWYNNNYHEYTLKKEEMMKMNDELKMDLCNCALNNDSLYGMILRT